MTANAAVRFPSSPPHAAATEVARAKVTGRTPLEQLLHALNQPLTGLQCSMEVALAAPRTLEQYVRGLQDGLELTDRMRALVGAIREVTDMEDKKNAVRNHEEWSIADVNTVLRTALDDLAPAHDEARDRRAGCAGAFGSRVDANLFPPGEIDSSHRDATSGGDSRGAVFSLSAISELEIPRVKR